MCELIANSFQSLWKGVQETSITAWKQVEPAVTEAGNTIRQTYEWAGREVEILTNKHLPQNVAKIVSDTVWGLPYSIATYFLPGICFEIVTGVVAGIWERYPHSFESQVGPENRRRIFVGLQNGCLLRIAVDVATLIATQRWQLLIPIIYNVTMAFQYRGYAQAATPPVPAPA